MKSRVDLDRYSGPRSPVSEVGGRGRLHSPEDREQVARERMEGHCNRRRSAGSADWPNVQLSVEPARGFDCTHDAGPDPFSA